MVAILVSDNWGNRRVNKVVWRCIGEGCVVLVGS